MYNPPEFSLQIPHKGGHTTYGNGQLSSHWGISDGGVDPTPEVKLHLDA